MSNISNSSTHISPDGARIAIDKWYMLPLLFLIISGFVIILGIAATVHICIKDCDREEREDCAQSSIIKEYKRDFTKLLKNLQDLIVKGWHPDVRAEYWEDYRAEEHLLHCLENFEDINLDGELKTGAAEYKQGISLEKVYATENPRGITEKPDEYKRDSNSNDDQILHRLNLSIDKKFEKIMSGGSLS